MTALHSKSLRLFAGLAFALTATSAIAEQVSREEEIVNLRLGQRILVDDGSCPAGQIKEVSGTQMTANGIARAHQVYSASRTAEMKSGF